MILNRQHKKTLATQARKKIVIQQANSTPDGEGGFTDAWVAVATVWASISPIRADQRAQYATLNVEATHLIRVRGLVDVEEKYRITYDSRIFEVLTVENIQERNFMKVCLCLERR